MIDRVEVTPRMLTLSRHGFTRHAARTIALATACFTGPPYCHADDSEGLRTFREAIEPVLVKECYRCHSAKVEKPKGGLRLDSRQGMLHGGDTGPAVVPGKSSESLLIQAIRHEDGLEMPPKAPRLADEVVARFVKWIDAGAPAPTAAPATAIVAPGLDEARRHWAFQPIVRPDPPAVNDPAWVETPVDAFVLAKLEARGWHPAPEASRSDWLRRLTFDLTGLPPTPEEVEAFERDASPNAFDRVADRLLASPRYGERWAQHWLDVARFAETDGFEHDLVRPNAWRYRDWVIDALNHDLPFDEFVRQQIAGDLLYPGDPQATVATGFLLCGPDMPDLNLQEERRHVVLNEMTATVGSVFLAMQLGCAQCHDHKYDPIRQHDFYRLRAFFEPADIFRDHPIPSAKELAARQAAEAALDPAFKVAEERRYELEATGRDQFRGKNPDVQPTIKELLAELSAEERTEHAALVKRLKSAPKLPALPQGRVLAEGKPCSARLYLRGDFRQPGLDLEPGVPRVLLASSLLEGDSDAAPRTKLARWLASPDNPLTARVIVNRLWQWHFGVPLSTNPSDFGVMGVEPSHPEMLDWLARRFMADGWSLKKMHRLLVTSEAYCAASTPGDHEWTASQTETARQAWQHFQAIDPTNVLLWHRQPMRLDGEAIRDAMLAASDWLSPRRGGPGIRPPLPLEITATLLKDQWVVSGDDEDHRRRGIYLFVRRNLRFPMFDVFDRPDTNASCAVRHESTTALQSLTLLNSEFGLRAARLLAGVVMHSHPGKSSEQIAAAYLRIFNRPATADEVRAGEEFLDSQAKRVRAQRREAEELALPEGIAPGDSAASAALVDLCLTLFNANEFIYLD
jgi:hypothetical protein